MTEPLAILSLCEWCGIGLPSQLSQPFQSSLNTRSQRASHTAHWVSPFTVDISGPETLSPAECDFVHVLGTSKSSHGPCFKELTICWGSICRRPDIFVEPWGHWWSYSAGSFLTSSPRPAAVLPFV